MYIMEKAYRLDMVEEAVSVADDIMESDENYQIVISGWQAYVPELGLALHAGVFCQYDESEQAYLPDFSVTVIKEAEERMKETKEGDWLYYEQLSCFICIPDEEGTEILKS